ncbi:MAG: isoprenylcysteine carboxylmethyltransferase family protein [Spirochaetales bacterium]|nr:isoprenylcysteine carboxylmethyltransferase family protein [Spirochaetales bacterium]
MDYIRILMLVFLSSLYVLLIGRTVQLRIQGVKPFTLAKGKKGFKGVIEFLFAVGLIIWTAEIILHSLNIDFHFLPLFFYAYIFDLFFLKIIGIVLIAVGLIIFVMALIAFGTSWRVGIDKENAGALRTGGIFSISRNPIFLFIDLFFIGTFFVYNNLLFLIFMVLEVIGIHYQILQEEKFLLSLYGDAYKDYTKKVRRYI